MDLDHYPDHICDIVSYLSQDIDIHCRQSGLALKEVPVSIGQSHAMELISFTKQQRFGININLSISKFRIAN